MSEPGGQEEDKQNPSEDVVETTSDSEKEGTQIGYTKSDDFSEYLVQRVSRRNQPYSSEGNIHFQLLNEYDPLPESVTHEIDESGSLGDVISKEEKSHWIRQIQCSLFIPKSLAAEVTSYMLAQSLDEMYDDENINQDDILSLVAEEYGEANNEESQVPETTEK